MCNSCIERTFPAGDGMWWFGMWFAIAGRVRIMLCLGHVWSRVLACRVQNKRHTSYQYADEKDGCQHADLARECAFFVRCSIIIMNRLLLLTSRIVLHRNGWSFLLRTLLRELMLFNDAPPRPF